MTRGTDTDAWTYYQFGTRSLGDQIRALVLDELDQSPDGGAISLKLREQSSSSLPPLVAIGAESIQAAIQAGNAQGIRDVTRILFARYGNEDAVAVTYLGEHPELLTKIRDAVAREVALRCVDAVLADRFVLEGVPIPTDPKKVVISLGPD